MDPTDESRMLFRGFLAFVDPLKLSAIPCIKELYSRGVAIKVLHVICLLCVSELWVSKRHMFKYLQMAPLALM